MSLPVVSAKVQLDSKKRQNKMCTWQDCSATFKVLADSATPQPPRRTSRSAAATTSASTSCLPGASAPERVKCWALPAFFPAAEG